MDKSRQVDFYISQQTDEAAREFILLRLLDKALSAEKRMLVMLDNLSQQQSIGRQLWEMQHSLFLPHEILTEERSHTLCPILLTNAESIDEQRVDLAIVKVDIIIDLSTKNRSFEFPRVIVIGNQAPNQLAACREKYKTYKDLGIMPKTIKV